MSQTLLHALTPMAEAPMHEPPPMELSPNNIVLFHPHIPAKAFRNVAEVLRTRWIGQGPRVDEFEERFSAKFGGGRCSVAVGAGTDALHIAYVLAGLKPGDEVITPIFTCTATNIPLLYMGVRIVFADVQPETMNIDPVDVRRRVTEKTKAIVCVHYGGLPCDMDELQTVADEFGIPIIEDCAHALGSVYRGKLIGQISDFSMFSFQAIKHITTGDGGMLVLKNPSLADKARRLRWFGIDRKAKQKGIWENDIFEVGYKSQMTDISASLGLAALDEFDCVLTHRRALFDAYEQGLGHIAGISMVGAGLHDRAHAAWLCTVLAENREGLCAKLRENGIEAAQVHYRNDRYSIFGGRQCGYANMDSIEQKYLVLPLHTKIGLGDVEFICSVVHSGW